MAAGGRHRIGWGLRFAAILGVAVLGAIAAATLPDHPYQRWQLVEDTLYANATWSYERLHFDPRPVDVAILGASRTLMGLSAPRIAATLSAAGTPLAVANLSVIEDGRNLQWAIADELFRTKRPRVVVVMINETVHRWGHPGFRYVAPAAAVAAPPDPLLHNSPTDLIFLPYRQPMLFAAAAAPGLVGLRDRFDPVRYAAKTSDYSVSHTLADGKHIDMDRVVSADELRAEAAAFARIRHRSSLPSWLAARTDVDDAVYTDAIARLAKANGARLVFVFLPEFGQPTTIASRARYARLGRIADFGDLATNPALFQSFAHLNHRGALIASDRLAATVTQVLGGARAAGDRIAAPNTAMTSDTAAAR